MTHLFIDHQAAEFNQSVQTWADLLRQLDVAMDARGRVLTEVQFDGVSEPTFREPLALTRPLAAVARVDAATATPADLLRDCLLEAAGTVAGLRDEAVQVADRYRTGQPGDGHARLAHIATQLGQLLTLIQTLQGPLGLVTASATEAAGAETVELERFGAFIDDLFQAEQGADHYTVADILEYDLVPFLQSWQTRFERLAG